MKNKKGITLIALVITSIVLLILAGVSINMALGDNGIFGKSKKARREKIVAEKIEEVKMAIASVVIDNNGDATGVIISSNSDSNVIPKIKQNYFKSNEQNSIEGMSTDEMQEEGMDDFDEDELLNLLGMVKYGKASTGLSEELLLIVDKDFNVEEYDGSTTSPYSDLPKVAIETSSYTCKSGKSVYCNSPDLSGFNPESTYYVVYEEDKNGNEVEKIAGRIDRVAEPENWYDYGKTKPSQSEEETEIDSHWANVVTVTGNNVIYWTWIPRYKYTLDNDNQKVNAEFVDEFDKCLDSNGQEVDVSSYLLPKSFRFGEDADLDNPTQPYANLYGFWMSKYEMQDTELPENEKIIQERHGNSIEISTISTPDDPTNPTIIQPTGKYRIYVEGVEVEANDYDKNTGVSLPYTIKGLRRTRKYDICVESIDRNKMIGRTTGLSSNNIKVDMSGFNPENTYYVIYEKDKEGNEVEKIAGRIDKISQPENWYNYDKKVWANLVTVNDENVIYWTYIPRYEYKLAGNRKDGTTGNTPETRITQIEYIQKSQTTADPGYEIPKSFRFGNDGDLDDSTKTDYIELDGYWMSKFEMQESEKHDKELMRKKIVGNKVTVTSTKPEGTYTIYLNGEKKIENKTLPQELTLDSDGKCNIMLINETDNRIVAESRTQYIEIDLSGFNSECTYYVEYELDSNGNEIESYTTKIELDENGNATNMPKDWFDYDNKKWANIVTINKDENNNDKIIYWTYIPRYEYKLDGQNQIVDVKYISVDQETPDSGYVIPKSFRFGNDGDSDDETKTDFVELKGYWMSKFELQE